MDSNISSVHASRVAVGCVDGIVGYLDGDPDIVVVVVEIVSSI